MANLGPITGVQLRRAARLMGRRKAGGADGLQAGDWAEWPHQHWQMAELLQLCEKQSTS